MVASELDIGCKRVIVPDRLPRLVELTVSHEVCDPGKPWAAPLVLGW